MIFWSRVIVGSSFARFKNSLGADNQGNPLHVRFDLSFYIYYGTANPGPWNPEQRPGDNKWTCGIFARDPDTGNARWFYQAIPHDLYDYDAINELVLLDLPMNGEIRKVLVRPKRNGYIYVIDRITGEVLSADPFYQNINSTKGVDLKTGQLIYNPEKQPTLGKVVRDICPTAPGAKDWNPSAFSPRTGLLYIPHMNVCMDWESIEVNYIAGTPYVGANVRMFAGGRAATAASSPPGTRSGAQPPGKLRRIFRCGAGRSQRRAISSSTEP